MEIKVEKIYVVGNKEFKNKKDAEKRVQELNEKKESRKESRDWMYA